MPSLPPIPSPPAHLIREFCVRWLPLLVFAGAGLGAATLYRNLGLGRSLTGMGDGPRAYVLAAHACMIVRQVVPPHTRVRRGDPVAVVRPVDPGAELDIARARVDIARLAAASTSAQRNAIDIERLRVDLVRARSDLAIARVRQTFADRDLARLEPLRRDGLVSEGTFDVSVGARDLHAAEAAELARAVADLEKRIEVLSTPMGGGPDIADVERELEALDDSASRLMGETVLVAPMDGTVGLFPRQAGEFVVEGEVVAVVQADRADRIVGYLRQPFGFDPRPGIPVTVRQRSGARLRFDAEIRHVGAQFEVVTNALAIVREGALIDAALPIFIDVPADIHVRPGEIVDVLLRRTELASAMASGDAGAIRTTPTP